MADARKAVVMMLSETFEKSGYTNLILDKYLKKYTFSQAEKRFAAALFYGTVERKITLDYIISHYVKKKTDDVVRQILRCGIYQIKYMDSVPDAAAVSESVRLASVFRKKSAGSLINAVLRNFIRDGKKINYPSDYISSLEARYSVPGELIKALTDDYGAEKIMPFLRDSLEKPPVMIRRNTRICTKEEFESEFESSEIKEHELINDCYYYNGQDISGCPAFKKGMFHVQDAASQLCCMALDINENDRTVYDVCAAPGGKTFTIAQSLDGIVYAWDIHKHRTELIKSGAKKLGLDNIRALTGDASRLDTDMPIADKILCDVPCSGYGVIRKKPEIKYKSISENKNLPELQYKILCCASQHLKRGGAAVYSTCTLSKAENEENIKRFLSEHKDFEAVCPLPGFELTKNMKYVTLMPDMFGSDGFFIAKLIRK